jgi:hypothetical protein
VSSPVVINQATSTGGFESLSDPQDQIKTLSAVLQQSLGSLLKRNPIIFA